MKTDELNELIDAVLDGECSEADFLRLEAEMHVSEDARQAYYERMKLHTALSLESAESKVIRPSRFDWQSNPRRSWLRLPAEATGIAAAILLTLVGTLGWWLGRENSPGEIAKTEPAAFGFGVLAEQSDAVWETQNLSRGDLLPQGSLKLKSGLAQLDLFSGVTVILQGEAEFEIHSAMEMTVRSGKLRASVPKPARGFKVRTESGDVVDLGTEFALDVTEQHADLHVFDGEIQWHPSSDSIRTLIDGDSLRWTESGEEAQPDLLKFPAEGDLESSRAQRLAAWNAHSADLRNDSRLLAYFPMAQPGNWDRQLVDESGAGRDGVIVRGKRTTNRWEEQDQALDFSPTGSRVRLSIPGEHSALTLTCWVKIDSLDRWYNSLFLTDGHELHEPHWQIMDDGRLFFSVKAHNKAGRGNPDKHIAFSPPIWTPANSGQWMHLTTVYDSAAKTTTHYVNGEQISQDQLPDHMVVEKVRIGAASIGNWSEPMREDPHFAVRNLNGAMDDFAIFGAALNASEVAELFERGRP